MNGILHIRRLHILGSREDLMMNSLELQVIIEKFFKNILISDTICRLFILVNICKIGLKNLMEDAYNIESKKDNLNNLEILLQILSSRIPIVMQKEKLILLILPCLRKNRSQLRICSRNIQKILKLKLTKLIILIIIV